jgi:hydrogenase nickel incorporation protein HypA/HybF
MHELGIADAMLKMVTRIAGDDSLNKVNKVTVELGDLSGVVPRFLSDCWEAVIDGTQFKDTVLVINTVPGILRCEDCKNEFTANLDDLTCPICKGRKLTPLTGRDLTITEIEGY